MAESTDAPFNASDLVNGTNVNAVVKTLQSGAVWFDPYNYTISSSYYPLRPNPTEAAFKIVGKMMEQGLVGEMDVTQFVKIVNDVAEIVRTT